MAGLLTFCALLVSQEMQRVPKRVQPPSRVVQARRFLAQRGWPASDARPVAGSLRAATPFPQPNDVTASTATWQPLGPAAVATTRYGPVTGRVSSIAFDPADPTGNRVYIGTTGGGVWLSQNAATGNAATVQFAPLTDAVGGMTLTGAASISIGATTVQPGGTGVVLAGTGDPNDALDSYYGSGILRSADGGNTWSLIQFTADLNWYFGGEAFAGFAWSTANPQLVVTAVSQSLDALRVNATYPHSSYEGLYYSTDGGATWALARITDGNGTDLQGPAFAFAQPDGNAATSVVWNPVRKLFLAAVRFHGFYQSADGATWTRMTTQPADGLTSANCPSNPGLTGSPHCPIFRGSLAVNPQTGDTFAWTVDLNNQDQGLWQDRCSLGAGVCTNQNLTFSQKWSTTAIETNDPQQGPKTIEDGDYTLALAAVPSAQDTLLLAGTDDLWKCSLAAGCPWSNTTNTSTCGSAQVAPYQHALAWSSTNPSEILVGNDSGLWRSLDAVGESGPACNPSDATHFQNLNSGLGSLAEVESMSVSTSPYTMMTGLGVNGTAGVKSTPGPTTVWPQILDGDGGPVAIDATNPTNWYVNNQAGVSIHACAQSDACTPADFGATPIITSADLGGDGDAMPVPAPFLVDPLDASQLLIGTCRVWRGPANGSSWNSANAISPFLDGMHGNGPCNSDPLIRSIAATALSDGTEVIYAGIYGALDGGGTIAGHIFRAVFDPNSNAIPTWSDLTANPVTNDTAAMNAFEFDISSLFIDPHDPTGNTVYATVEGMPDFLANVRTIYRSTDGGAHWQTLNSNLPSSPANSVVVDPQNANTVYIALDSGVFSTQQVGNCPGASCWSAYGSGLPQSPVTQLGVAGNVLVAGTYGRGAWQIPLWTGATQWTTAIASSGTITFAAQAYDSTSNPQTVTVTNTGALALTISSIAVSGDFGESDTCQGAAIGAGASCSVQVTFTPTQSGARTGQLTIQGNVNGGELGVSLSGTGDSPTGITMAPATLSFGPIALKVTSSPLQVTVQNATASSVLVSNVAVTGPFAISANACGTTLAANAGCQLLITFTPTQAGAAAGVLTLVDGAGTQSVAVSGNGAAPPTDTLSPTSLTFPSTIAGQVSAQQTVSLTNSGALPLTSIVATASGPFQVSGNCTTQLAANSSCTFGVVFDPASAGAQNGTLTIVDALHTQTVALTGTGLAPPQLGVNPTTLNFPLQSLGVTGSPLPLTISNTGGAPMANIGFLIVGQSAGSFAIGATTCGATLSNGSSCTVQVVFTPTAAGGAAATLAISSSTLGVKAFQVPLTGTGQALAGINVSPAQMTLTEATLGQASVAQTATITNTSTQLANGLALAVGTPFSLGQSTCGTTLAAGASCSAGVIFTPVINGAASGTLAITSTTSNSAIVLLNGIGGLAGSLQLQPAVLSFPTTGVGLASKTQTVTLTNTGPVDLSALALNASSGFQLAGTTCASTLAIGASCTAGVAFAPSTAGQQTGNLTLSSSSLATPAQATLSGMGFDFGATVSGASSQTIASGQIASFMLVLSPTNGSSGTFTLQCGSLPAGAACSFNPATETVGANSTGNVTVQIATGHSANSTRSPGGSIWGAGVALCAFVFLPLAWVRRRRVLGLVVLLALLIGGVSSCAGSGGGSGGSPEGGQGGSNASTGTFSIPVTVSANGVAHTVTLTLTVD